MVGGDISSLELGMDGAELFCECLALTTLVVGQVLPEHFVNQTPDPEMNVREIADKMLHEIEQLPAILIGKRGSTQPHDSLGNQNGETPDLTLRWQVAADQAEVAALAVDPEAQVSYKGGTLSAENYLFKLAGDLLIHSWDVGEAIGMVVRFKPDIAEAVMETTVIPNQTAIVRHTLASNRKFHVPATADLQTRLLALFGRSNDWTVN